MVFGKLVTRNFRGELTSDDLPPGTKFPGLRWELSEETLREIKQIEQALKRGISALPALLFD